MVDVDNVCNVCGSQDRDTWIRRAADYITGAEFSVTRCRRCGLGRTEPQPESMEWHYPARYRQYRGLTLRILRVLYRVRVMAWLRHLPRPGMALEVGCGTGWMLGALRDNGWRVVGSERTTEAASDAAATNGIPTFVGDLTALQPAQFNLIIFFQALEHLADPVSALRMAADLLAPGGSMVVAVPNVSSWQAAVFRSAWFHLDVPRHRHHFSQQALRIAFQQVGLHVVRTRMVSVEHDPYGVLQSLMNSIGFPQNLLTRYLMGTAQASRMGAAVTAACAGLLAIPSAAIAVGGWAFGSGAILEMWAMKS